MRTPASILLLLACAGAVKGQEFTLTRTDGQQTPARLVAIAAERLTVATDTGKTEVPLAELLGVQGPAPRVSARVAVHLAGGDELKGELSGGDDLGDHVLVRSTVLGPREILVDRLATIVFRERAATAGLTSFAIPKGTRQDEALFRKARRGFDMITGELDRFTAEGVRFVPYGRNVARSYRYETLAALTIRGGDPRETRAGWLLLTTGGDRLGVDVTGLSAKGVQVKTEFGAVTVPLSQVAALTPLRGDRVFLSDLEPVRVDEASSDDAVGPTLFSYRRDRTVSGGLTAERRSAADGFLVAGGRTYAKGLGVHSRCALTYRVPKGFTKFVAHVAIDDEVKALGVKGDVDVRVRLKGKVLFEKKGIRRGQAAVGTGVLTVAPGDLLILEVGFGKGLFLGDRVDWLSAVFLK